MSSYKMWATRFWIDNVLVCLDRVDVEDREYFW